MERILPHLALVNTVLVTTSGVFVLLGYYFIRRKDRRRHMWSMLTATSLQALFFVSYVVRISLQGTTRFEGPQAAHIVYLAILGTHSLLAAANVPFILVTLNRARVKRFAAHRRIARITLPIWVYVSATGPIIYIVLHVLYQK